MAQRRPGNTKRPNDHVNGHLNGYPNGHIDTGLREKTDYSRWRLLDEDGRHTWHYLTDDEDAAKWPQTTYDKYWLGLDTGAPELPPPTRLSQSIENCLTFYSRLQLPSGQWACEYSGPMFLLPGLVFTWYVTNTNVSDAYKLEIKNYLFARQAKDGGWGLHIEGISSVYGTAMNYIVCRICGADADHPRMIRARAKLHQLGGATNGPHWSKFWLSVLGVATWDIVNPVPPELWLLPDWVPIAPWRWWIHMRMVFLGMSWIWSKKWIAPETELIRQLRQEVFVKPYEEINFGAHRNSISPTDNYHAKTWVLNLINFLLVWIWIPFLRTVSLVQKAEAWTWRLVQYEDANTDYADLAPVNAPINTLICYIQEGPDSYSFRRHLERLNDYMWMKDEGMLMNGTNGVQVWDTAFTIQAVVEAGLAESAKWKPMLTRALGFLDRHQLREEVVEQAICYRQSRKGAWPFSTRVQGYTVSDCTSEAVKAILMLQKEHNYEPLVSDDRLRDAVDVVLTMQNDDTGGFASYEPRRGSELLEYLNAAEVFGRIMVEYDYCECTTAVVTDLSMFKKLYNYRTKDITNAINRALAYLRRAQREDGSWYGAWGICFTYGAMFSLESLASVGEFYHNSDSSRRGCDFLLSKQMADGGWGESYKGCEEKRYVHHERSQVVNTAWACIGLMMAECPDKQAIKKGLTLIMSRQQRNGEWLQEAIEGVFNCSVMITYPNYKFYFPIKAFGMYIKRYGDEELL